MVSNTNLYVYLCITRHKDNTHLANHKERKYSFIGTNDEEAYKIFRTFVKEGPKNEFARLYKSVNKRDNAKLHKALLYFLVDNPEYPMEKMGRKLVGLALQSKNKAERKWMFDFDSNDLNLLNQFKSDILAVDNSVNLTTVPTVSGYSIVTSHGFYSEDLLKKYKGIVELKRDDMLLLTHDTNYK